MGYIIIKSNQFTLVVVLVAVRNVWFNAGWKRAARAHLQLHVNGGGNLILREYGNRGPRRYRILWENGVPQRKKRIVWDSGDGQVVC